jgi:hypothetical protein
LDLAVAIVTTAASDALTWVSYLVAMTTIYAVTLLGIDALLTAQQSHRRRRAELSRINDEASRALQRISGAFLVAQRRIRDEAAKSQELQCFTIIDDSVGYERGRLSESGLRR